MPLGSGIGGMWGGMGWDGDGIGGGYGVGWSEMRWAMGWDGVG